MKFKRCLLTVAVLLGTATFLAQGQEPKEPAAGEIASPAHAAPKAQAGEPNAYAQLIGKNARSKEGVFTVHSVKDKIYYEIPTSELGKDFLWVSTMAKVP